LMVASRNGRTEEHKLLMASFRIRKDFVNARVKDSPSASRVFWAGGGIAMFPSSERTERSLAKHYKHATVAVLTPPVREEGAQWI